MTAQQIQQELGTTKAAAYSIMGQLDKVRFPGTRRVYVRRDDVLRLIERSTTR
ncbi:MAG: hypothetical protein OXG37_00295 [Actinomycetia bacterium]|nr:hypothetical protein [Actinomycetes bacterium]